MLPENLPGERFRTKRVTIAAQPFAGFAAESAREGEQVRIQFRYAVTADDPRFYLLINQLSNDFLAKASIDGDSITSFFVTQRPDGSAEVYTDYPVTVQVQVTRDVKAGEPVYESDVNISTIDRYYPYGLTLQPDDVVICAMKVGWKYGLFFDASREINEEQIWHQLGDLYRSLQIDRVFSNIEKRVRLAEQAHIMTEGKTDWRHIEAARRTLGIDVQLGYPTTDDSLGDVALLQVCERLSAFGPPNRNKVIAVFDRDNPQVLRKLEARGPLDGFQAWGNNVYSFAIPTPAHRQGYKHISIEMLYTDADIATTTSDGKRLYFDNETKKEVLPGNVFRYAPIPPVESEELNKKPYGDEADLIVNDEGRHVGLSKARFAEFVYDGVGDFGRLDRSDFEPIFRIIKDILLRPS
jgi:hypothetical protein